MKTLGEFVTSVKIHLMGFGMEENRAQQEAELAGERHTVAVMARRMYDKDMLTHGGPVWYGSEEWKTDFFKRQCEQHKAFLEGKKVRDGQGNRDQNPYRRQVPHMTMRLLELESEWDRGFKGEIE